MCIKRTKPSGGENRSPATQRLHAAKTTMLKQCTIYEPIAPIQRVTLEPLMRVCAVSLQCIVLALLFIDDILYNDVPVSDHEDHDSFASVVLMVVMLKTVYVVEERRVRWRGRVWLY
jgi:hypothetical protein